MSNRIDEAERLMVEAHAGQVRKHGAPYHTHPLAVMRILRDELGVRAEDALVAALLHDVVEDTPVTAVEVERRFGSTVAQYVSGVTKPQRPAGMSKEEFGRGYYPGLRAKPDAVRQIKIADRIHNLRELPSADRAFQERYVVDTEELMKALAGTAGYDLLAAEYERAKAFVRSREP
jgi:GTP diphosphokinase / guanosine-3',5'-bis(diphosphate) 3'-diphosphatase